MSPNGDVFLTFTLDLALEEAPAATPLTFGDFQLAAGTEAPFTLAGACHGAAGDVPSSGSGTDYVPAPWGDDPDMAPGTQAPLPRPR